MLWRLYIYFDTGVITYLKYYNYIGNSILLLKYSSNKTGYILDVKTFIGDCLSTSQFLLVINPYMWSIFGHNVGKKYS